VIDRLRERIELPGSSRHDLPKTQSGSDVHAKEDIQDPPPHGEVTIPSTKSFRSNSRSSSCCKSFSKEISRPDSR